MERNNKVDGQGWALAGVDETRGFDEKSRFLFADICAIS